MDLVNLFFAMLIQMLLFALSFALMIGGAFIACYVVGWVIGAITVVREIGVKNLFLHWSVLKAGIKDAHHQGMGFASEIFGFKRHVVFVPK